MLAPDALVNEHVSQTRNQEMIDMLTRATIAAWKQNSLKQPKVNWRKHCSLIRWISMSTGVLKQHHSCN